jgi:hypothetical protein
VLIGAVVRRIPQCQNSVFAPSDWPPSESAQ